MSPNVKQPKFRWITLGGVIAVVIWLVASGLFALYISFSGSYNKTYGSLATVIMFLVWLWISNIAILLGLEFDAETERERAIRAGMPADVEPFAELRDTRKLDDEEKRRVEHAETASVEHTPANTKPDQQSDTAQRRPGLAGGSAHVFTSSSDRAGLPTHQHKDPCQRSFGDAHQRGRPYSAGSLMTMSVRIAPKRIRRVASPGGLISPVVDSDGLQRCLRIILPAHRGTQSCIRGLAGHR